MKLVKLPNNQYVNPDHIVRVYAEQGDSYHGQYVTLVWLADGNGITLSAKLEDVLQAICDRDESA